MAEGRPLPSRRRTFSLRFQLNFEGNILNEHSSNAPGKHGSHLHECLQPDNGTAPNPLALVPAVSLDGS
jgi:hypothetical protein